MCATYKEEKHIKYCLGSALLELMKQNSFSEITVNEICSAAYIGRATYYNYAGGKREKDDLITFKLKRDYKKYVSERRAKGLSKTDNGGDTFNFVYDNREIFKLLHRDRLNNTLIQFLTYAEGNSESKGDQAYIDQYLAMGYLGILQKWDEENYSKTALEVAYIVYNKHADLIKWHIQRYLDITGSGNQ